MTIAESTAPESTEQPVQPEAPPAQVKQPRSWSPPKSPISRQQADELGRAAVKALMAVARFVAGIARSGVRVLWQLWCAIEAVPAAVRLFVAAGVVMLLGIVGAITRHTTFGLVCTVVVIPVCAGILGALGHRWYSGLSTQTTRPAQTAEPVAFDLQRSVQYVDAKLAQALSSFGTEHHQQAVIALFQAKTAVELTLGTEQDPASYVDVPLRADDYGLRPRIKAGSSSALRESNSLAAS